MPTYIHFSREQKERAASVDLEQFLRSRGEKLIPSGREKRLASDHSITVRGNEWYDHAEETGGSAISFVRRFYGLDYPEAVSLLLGGEGGTGYSSASQRKEESPKPFELPPRNDNMHRLFAYLTQHRKIANGIVSFFVHEKLLYEDAKYHNVVFVGTDENGIARHAHKRSTASLGKPFRLTVEGSDPRYSFHHIGTDGSLYAFEAPIDLLSYITLNPDEWEKHSYVACCGTSVLPVLNMLERLPRVDTVYLCLDNDNAGHKACKRMTDQIREKHNINIKRLVPEHKDWNDDLIRQDECEVDYSCQTFG